MQRFRICMEALDLSKLVPNIRASSTPHAVNENRTPHLQGIFRVSIHWCTLKSCGREKAMRSTHGLSNCRFPADTARESIAKKMAYKLWQLLFDRRPSVERYGANSAATVPCSFRRPVAFKRATLRRSTYFVNQAIPVGSPLSAIKEDVFVHARARLSGENAIVTPKYFSIRRKWPRAFG
jgi:hypothetical protein